MQVWRGVLLVLAALQLVFMVGNVVSWVTGAAPPTYSWVDKGLGHALVAALLLGQVLDTK